MTTYSSESVKLPASIGAFRMKNFERTKNNTWVTKSIQTIDCKKQFGSKLSNQKWVDSNGLRYPWCFHLSHEDVKIGGAEDVEVGSNYL